jgi:hypothetical protein
MSVRFSLRFAGRSPRRLLGVATCEEPGRENVVAIIGVYMCASSGSSCVSSNIECNSSKSRKQP